MSASFIRPLLDASNHGACRLVNARTGLTLASRLETAFESASRRRGLLGRDSLPAGDALIIAPCPAIHTFFMQFPIDVIFAARDGHVVRICRHVRPWRIAYAVRAFAAIEAPAGAPQATDVRRGDRLIVVADRSGSPSGATR